MDLQTVQNEIRANADLLKEQMRREETLRAGLRDDNAAIFPIAPIYISALNFYPMPEPRADGSFHYRQLADFEDAAFVDVAYRTLLRHAPDPEGLAFYTRMLRSPRKTKIEVLARLRYSHEGRAQKVRLRGGLPAAAVAALGYVPVLNIIIDWFAELVFLPRTVRRLRLQNEQTRQATNQNFARLAAKTNEQSRVLNQIAESVARAKSQDRRDES